MRREGHRPGRSRCRGPDLVGNGDVGHRQFRPHPYCFAHRPVCSGFGATVATNFVVSASLYLSTWRVLWKKHVRPEAEDVGSVRASSGVAVTALAHPPPVAPTLARAMYGMPRGLWGSGLLYFGSIRVASLVTRDFRSEEAAVRSNKVTIIWGILTLVSLLIVLALMVLGVVSL